MNIKKRFMFINLIIQDKINSSPDYNCFSYYFEFNI